MAIIGPRQGRQVAGVDVLAERDERSLELMLSVDNLLDEEARNHLSFRKDDQVLPGRNIQVGLRGTF